MKITRKNFLNSLLTISGFGTLFAIFYPLISYLIPPKVVESTPSSIKAGNLKLFEKKKAVIVKYGREPVIVVKDNQNKFHALSATCTHLQCIVQYKEDTEQIWCACHNGLYDLNGKNISGPPPRPLTNYEVKVLNNEVIIKRVS